VEVSGHLHASAGERAPDRKLGGPRVGLDAVTKKKIPEQIKFGKCLLLLSS